MGRVKKTQVAWALGALAQAGRLQCAPRAKGCRLDSGKAGGGRKPRSEDHSKDRGGTNNDSDFNPSSNSAGDRLPLRSTAFRTIDEGLLNTVSSRRCRLAQGGLEGRVLGG